MKILKTIFFGIILFLLMSNKNYGQLPENCTEDKITYCGYDGGKGGNYFRLEISKDSTILYQHRINYGLNYKIATRMELWQQLVHIDTKAIDKIISSESQIEYNGTDITLVVCLDKKKHSFMNGNISGSKEVLDFMAILDKEIPRVVKTGFIGKSYTALTGTACKEFQDGGCTINNYCNIIFDEDTATVSYTVAASCTSKERENLYEQNPPPARILKWHVGYNVIVIEGFDGYDALQFSEEKLWCRKAVNGQNIYTEFVKQQ